MKRKTSRRPPMNYWDSKRGGWGRGGGSIIKIFWPIELNDLWSKKICRPKIIVWSGATFILRWSCSKEIPQKPFVQNLYFNEIVVIKRIGNQLPICPIWICCALVDGQHFCRFVKGGIIGISSSNLNSCQGGGFYWTYKIPCQDLECF